MTRPLIGITTDVVEGRFRVSHAYADAVAAAGGIPLLLPACPGGAAAYARLCAGFVFSGGDDPIMERWGVSTHVKATPVAARRQDFELALLDELARRPSVPVLGVCLGMQLMALHAGGMIDQHLPDTLGTADQHWDCHEHPVRPETARPWPAAPGVVCSHHRQAVTDPGSLAVTALAPDGVIEAIEAPERAFYIGVQWHPERTADPGLGRDLFRRLVDAASGRLPAKAPIASTGSHRGPV